MVPTLEQDQQSAEYITIGEAAQRTGLTQRTLRYYEERGLLRPPARMSGGQRLYGQDDLDRLEQIVRMKKLLGFSLDEIKAAVEGEEARRRLCRSFRRERNPGRKRAQAEQAREIVTEQLCALDEKIAQMREMKRTLQRDLAKLDETIRQLQEGV